MSSQPTFRTGSHAKPRQAVDDFIFKENKIDEMTPEEASASDQYFGTLHLGSGMRSNWTRTNDIVTTQKDAEKCATGML